MKNRHLLAVMDEDLEALRPGVQLNTFAHFLNIDDLAVIRDSDISDEKKKYYLLNAFR